MSCNLQVACAGVSGRLLSAAQRASAWSVSFWNADSQHLAQ
jgi:hypothetical protein